MLEAAGFIIIGAVGGMSLAAFIISGRSRREREQIAAELTVMRGYVRSMRKAIATNNTPPSQ
jgi:hypothetical protein